MPEQFALIDTFRVKSGGKKRLDLSDLYHNDNDRKIIVVAKKVTYKLIEDDFDHFHHTTDSDKTVLKMLYIDRHDKIYYNGTGQYSNYKTKARNTGKTYLTEEELESLDDYIKRLVKHLSDKKN